jgi:hypothetical protein
VPTDVTPYQVVRERNNFGPMLKFRLFQHLPARFWFQAITEETQRWETNVYQTSYKGRNDYVFRSLPNVTAGYALTEHTNVYSNFFVIKDIYAAHSDLDFPTTMSTSMGIRRDFPVKSKTVLQLDMQARELWQTSHLHQADILPAINLTRIWTPNTILFGSLLLQMRSRNLFQGPQRELDPFYNAGIICRRGKWFFVAMGTYVTNFRSPPFSSSAVPPEGNVSMILDFEISRPVSKIPGVMAFIRAEPIYNWRSHFIEGQSGYDFRLYSGLRFSVSKQEYGTQIDQLKKQLQETAKKREAEREKQEKLKAPANIQPASLAPKPS